MRRRIRAGLGGRHGSWPSSAAPGTSRRSTRRRRRTPPTPPLLRGQPKVKVAVTWVPWTHRRLRRATGYGAGVVSPGWYDHVFRHPGPEGVSRFFVDAAHALRRRGMPASPDHLIAASRLADSLAALRRRPRAGLAEVLDAAESVLGGLPLVVDELVVGDAIGEVPPDAPQVPLARDLAAAQRAAAPEADGGRAGSSSSTCAPPNGLRRSHLLHRLTALGVPWGVLEEGRGSSGTFRETWRLAWEPELSVRLVELAGHGTTVEAAATSRLVEQAARLDAPRRRHRGGRPGAARRPARRAAPRRAACSGELAARTPDVAELMDALRPARRRAALRRRPRHRRRRACAWCSTSSCVRVVAGLGRRGRGPRRRRRAGDDRAHERRPGGARRRRPPGPPRRASRPCSSGSPSGAASTASSRAGPRGCSTTPAGGRPPTVERRLGRALTPRHAGRPPARRSSRASSPAAARSCSTTPSCAAPSTPGSPR